MKFKRLEEWEEDCVHTWLEFTQAVRSGMFIDYDGYGALATEENGVVVKSTTHISPSELKRFKKPRWVTHVIWYNK